MKFERVAVVGAGAWGTALANVLTRAGRQVTLCAREAAAAQRLEERRETPHLPGVQLDQYVRVVPMPADMSQQNAGLLAVPSQH
jgi:glycerol-3-phosphate dehydrogenase (NAD(P)+)